MSDPRAPTAPDPSPAAGPPVDEPGAPRADPGTAAPPPPRDLGRIGGFRAWGGRGRQARVLFVGRGPQRPEGRNRPAGRVLEVVTPGVATPQVAGAKQIHSRVVLEASEGGVCGEGDALVTGRADLAVSVVTADCVPVLVEAGDQVAAIHAGWRGLVDGVIPAALQRLEGQTRVPKDRWTAWIGPAIGACCYEVGPEVAERIAETISPEPVVRLPGRKPHVDLVAAARLQLGRAGVPTTWLVRCTRCDGDNLWSYRRLGRAAGRNLAFIWRTGE